MLIRFLLALIGIVVFTLPVWAEDRSSFVTHSGSLPAVEQFDWAKVRGLLEQVYKRSLDVIEDHVEFEGTLQPDAENGERRGRLSLKLYPKGKAHFEESLRAETRFGFSQKPGEGRVHFDFKLSQDPYTHPLFPEDYL